MNFLVINYEYPPIGGGAGVASAEIAQGLTRLNHHVCVLTSHWQNLATLEQPTPRLTIRRVPVFRKQQYAARSLEMLFFVYQGLNELKNIARTFHVDAVISFFGFPSGLIGLRAQKQFNCPHVISLRGLDVPGFDARNLQYHHLALSPLIKLIWSRANVLVPNSRHLKALSTSFFPRMAPKTHVIENGIAPCHKMKTRRHDRLELLTVSRFAKQKGLFFLIKAMAQFKKMSQLPWHLHMVGDGPLRTKLQKMIRNLHLSEHISLVGWQTPWSLKSYYENAHLLLHTSEDEGMSNAILEAMAHGVVVLASNTGGNPELIQHQETGLLYEKESQTDFLNTLKRFSKQWSTNPEVLQEISTSAIKHLHHRSWMSAALKYEGLIQRCLSQTRVAYKRASP